MQNVRQEQLLAILSERGDWMTSRQLAGLLGVSDRTIRSDVEAVNRRITPAPIESNVRQGYRVMEDARRPRKIPPGLRFPRPREAGVYTLYRSFCLRPGN